MNRHNLDARPLFHNIFLGQNKGLLFHIEYFKLFSGAICLPSCSGAMFLNNTLKKHLSNFIFHLEIKEYRS